MAGDLIHDGEGADRPVRCVGVGSHDPDAAGVAAAAKLAHRQLDSRLQPLRAAHEPSGLVEQDAGLLARGGDHDAFGVGCGDEVEEGDAAASVDFEFFFGTRMIVSVVPAK